MEKTWLRQCDGMGMHGFQSLAFTADVTEDRRSQKTEGYMDILCTNQMQKLIGQCLVQMDNDPKHTAEATQEFLKV